MYIGVYIYKGCPTASVAFASSSARTTPARRALSASLFRPDALGEVVPRPTPEEVLPPAPPCPSPSPSKAERAGGGCGG